MIVADTSAILALLDTDDRHHRALRTMYEARPDDWLLPWAILPEVDYLISNGLGARAQDAFLLDLVEGTFSVEYGGDRDVFRAHQLGKKYRALRMGLVDAVVMAVAERVRAAAIATLDLRHFGAVTLTGTPKLIPRDEL